MARHRTITNRFSSPEHTIKLPPRLNKYITSLGNRGHTCVIFTGSISKFSKPIVVGHNGFCGKDTCIYSKTADNIEMCRPVHAEEDAIIRYKKKHGRQRRKTISLFVGRANYKYSRPCWHCYNVMLETVKANYNISKIFYTSGSRSKIIKTSLTRMMIRPFRVSSFWSRKFQAPEYVELIIMDSGSLLVYIKQVQ